MITRKIRANVLQGRQSISCENSVFPAFMGTPSPEKARGNRRQLQTDTTQIRRKTVIDQIFLGGSFGKLRTVVGPIDGASFLAWVEQFLAPALRSGNIMVMDNLSSHKDPAIRRAIRSADAKLFYLPSYSPDLNPIERRFPS